MFLAQFDGPQKENFSLELCKYYKKILVVRKLFPESKALRGET